jgi:hypothetical protein
MHQLQSRVIIYDRNLVYSAGNILWLHLQHQAIVIMFIVQASGEKKMNPPHLGPLIN